MNNTAVQYKISTKVKTNKELQKPRIIQKFGGENVIEM